MNTLTRLAFGRPVTQASALPRVRPRPATLLIGRLLLATIFVLSGLTKFAQWEQTASAMSAQGIPVPIFLLFVAAVIEIVLGASLATGTFARLAAIGLFLYLIPVTLTFHDFWNLTGSERQEQMVNFLKNLAVMGGLLIVTAEGAGRYSIDSLLRKRFLRGE